LSRGVVVVLACVSAAPDARAQSADPQSLGTVTADERDRGTTLTIACSGVRVAVIDALKPDRDHDGIPDDDDDCPESISLASGTAGCSRLGEAVPVRP
jgi:hypothetical protein